MSWKMIGILFLFLFIVSCKRDDDKPPLSGDSLSTILRDTDETPSGVYHDTASGLTIDSSQIVPPGREKLLHRFTPIELRDIYVAYWPLRQKNPNDKEDQKFLKQKHLNAEELKAILEQGDQLGWKDDMRSKSKK